MFERALPFSELDAITSLLPYIKNNMKLIDVVVVSQQEAQKHIAEHGEDSKAGWESSKIEAALPTSPEVVFWNVES